MPDSIQTIFGCNWGNAAEFTDSDHLCMRKGKLNEKKLSTKDNCTLFLAQKIYSMNLRLSVTGGRRAHWRTPTSQRTLCVETMCTLSLNSRRHVVAILPVRRSASGWGSLWESSSFVPWFILNTFRDVSGVVPEWLWSSGFMRKSSSLAGAPSMRFSILLNSCDNFLVTLPSISSYTWVM